MIAAPARSPETRTTRRREWAASGEQETAARVAVEGDAVGQKVGDAVGPLASDEARNLFVDDAGAGGDRVGGVQLRRVAVADGRGDAAPAPSPTTRLARAAPPPAR